MSESPPRAHINTRIPSAAIWAFGAVMLLGLITLPFLIFKIMALTQNQAQGMSLAGLAQLPIPSKSMRCTVRETRDKGVVAARYELDADTLQQVRRTMTAPGRPDDAFFSKLDGLSPRETAWQPAVGAPGPWRTAAGAESARTWRAALDEGTGVLWILAEQRTGQ